MFCPQARCRTVAPDTFKVLLSQRRRWINSTIHNLMELVRVQDLCGTFCFSMQFVVFMDLLGTIVLREQDCFLFICSRYWQRLIWSFPVTFLSRRNLSHLFSYCSIDYTPTQSILRCHSAPSPCSSPRTPCHLNCPCHRENCIRFMDAHLSFVAPNMEFRTSGVLFLAFR